MAQFLADRALNLTSSNIVHLSRLAEKFNAINLAEGFPDFPAPPAIKNAAIAAINADFNQYRHVQGLCDQVAAMFETTQGLKVNPKTQVTICCGQSEALVAAVLAVINERDEVVLLDPSYETYEASVKLAGAKAKHVSLDPPNWNLDILRLENAMGSRTKAVIVNSPHNPTGKVFNEEELADIAKLCCRFDCLAITDEVYEHLVYTGTRHRSLATFPGMQDRTIVTSSISKTFSVTGWRIGWAIAPEAISSAIGSIHEKLVDSAPAPFQEAAVSALSSGPEYYLNLRAAYLDRRNLVCEMLEEAGLSVQYKPEGSFFVFARLPETYPLKDVDYVAELIKSAGVVIVPGCGFFHADSSSVDSYKDRYVRVAFCKNTATLLSAREAIRRHCKKSKGSEPAIMLTASYGATEGSTVWCISCTKSGLPNEFVSAV
ncbi:hypothetical protein AXG93_3348s1110 [Marchantia polymorpha subsp. ruderalis]|uniref:Aminotransferase class I/classII large domain-containing protein n=3 Tax=Marchantia polymorpha TaxID=3197 RepID=A0A176VPW3_MARPO|nr:hypothetical protein AXG93_3348s1110 [Marchantia polymorpha subsp. ruderalis]